MVVSVRVMVIVRGVFLNYSFLGVFGRGLFFLVRVVLIFRKFFIIFSLS